MTASRQARIHAKRYLTCAVLMLLGACSNVPSMPGSGKGESGEPAAAPSGPGLSSVASTVVDIPEVPKVGVIPPPPPHTWADEKEDVNENRALNFGLVSIPELEDYLNKLYAKAKQLADVPDWPGKVYVSSDTTVNAHSSAAGNIYINITVLQSAASEDEIFAVITHEFAHVYLNHQTAYRANLMTGTAVFLGKLVVIAATKNAGGDAWNAGDTLSIAGKLTDNVLIPNWQRSIEQQADRFGVTLSLKAGYSYPGGFKAFLERLASVDREYYAKAAAEEKAAREKKAKQTAPAPNFAKGLQTALNDSAGAFTHALGSSDASSIKNHDDAEVREKALTDEVRALPKVARACVRTAPWKDITKTRSVAEVFTHFALLKRIDELRSAHRQGEAIKLANVMASGATEADGTADITLYTLLHEEGRLPMEAQLAVLLRNQASPQRSWAAQMLAAQLIATKNPLQAKLFLEKEFEYFGKADPLVPDLIGFYTESLKSPMLAVALSLPCVASNPRYRQACMERAQTREQREEGKRKQTARSEAMGKNLGTKVGKFIGLEK
jgi:Zn-dependent protease with chaperone function